MAFTLLPRIGTALRVSTWALVCLVGIDGVARAQTPSAPGKGAKAAGDDGVGPLIAALASGDAAIREAAVRTLGQRGETILPELRVAMKAQPALSAAVAQVLGEMPQSASLAILETVAADPEERWRRTVVAGLGAQGPAITDVLATASKTSNRFVRTTAIEAIAASVAQAGDPLPGAGTAALVAAANDEDSRVRQVAVAALGRVGPQNDEVVAALVRKLSDDQDPRVRISAGSALELLFRQGTTTEGAVVALTECVQRDDIATVRAAAASALGFAGKEGERAAAALAKALSDRYGVVRQAAAQGLLQIGPSAAVAVAELARVLEEDEVPRVRWYAAGALGHAKEKAAPAVRSLAQALTHSDGNIRATAAQSLCQIGPAAKEAIPALIAALGDEGELTRQKAAEALGRLRLEAAAALPALEAAAEKERGPRAKTAMEWARGQIKP